MSPQRLLLLIGVPLGLLIVLFAPAWTGYDEHTHFARAADMATGSLFPTHEEGSGTPIPASYSEDTLLVQQNWLDGNPAWTAALTGDLLGSGPDGRMVHVDLRPTNASPPVAYLPAAVGMLVPVAVDAPGIVALWSGRLANLTAYLGLAALAVCWARRFRWTMTAVALLPMHLALAATISPDAVTVAAVLLLVALWTRIDDDAPISARALVGVSLLLALAKPPYFLLLALFPVAAIVRRSAQSLFAARVAGGALGVGLLLTLVNSSTKYQAVTSTMIDDQLTFQPEVQRDRLLGDVPGFLWASVETWFTEIHHYVQGWFRNYGFFTSDLPAVFPWALLVFLVLAARRLDAGDHERLCGGERGAMAFGVPGMLLVLFGSSYVYFTDHIDFDTIGQQMARYSAPLLVLMFIAWTPRRLPRLPALEKGYAEVAARATILAVPVLATTWILLTWMVTGTIDRY
ncbi:MAG: DUF2142 domain-containing protein [Actinobacteria bacterium]|nr:DUF2142 domain-containing protein [Actinomycetota bacterium]